MRVCKSAMHRKRLSKCLQNGIWGNSTARHIKTTKAKKKCSVRDTKEATKCLHTQANVTNKSKSEQKKKNIARRVYGELLIHLPYFIDSFILAFQ